jgi:alpha-glucuronidase
MKLVKTLLPILACLSALQAETGRQAWLRYAPLSDAAVRTYTATLPATAAVFGGSPVVANAQHELIAGVHGMLGRTLRTATTLPTEPAFLVGTLADIPLMKDAQVKLEPDAFLLTTRTLNGVTYTIVTGANDRGVLYGTFALLRKIATGEPIARVNEQQNPYAPIRWVNEWDRIAGSIERGYGGNSIFWEGGKVREDLSRVSEYGRLLASLGINGCDINNVNADVKVLGESVAGVARVADLFRPWGVRVAISIDFGSPKTIGGLDTFDPIDPKVIAWWKEKTDEFYKAIPDLGGFVLKADSEGRVGPATYNRTHAEAANVLARALKPHNGVLFYRGFVYDHRMDWNNPKNDRGRAAWDNFKPLDGTFDDNVIIQIKNGPIDFQVREPASPLFGALEKSNQAIELQVTQEYMGQSKHTVFLGQMWKEVLDFDMHAAAGPTPVKALVAGKVFHRPTGGFVGVANVGLDDSWYGNQMSQANLYAFGRLAWNPDLSAQRIIDEWTRQTFGDDPKVLAVVNGIQLSSWRTYENYTGPLGLQTLTDITGNHYGVNIEASERNGWGQWHRDDEQGVGMDRTSATGTGYIGQYRPAVVAVYESLQTCPDDLLLFLHHVPYTYKLHNGKTVIQYLYDSHYEGADAVAGYVKQWKSLKGLVDDQRYQQILDQLEYQAGQSIVWRDAVTVYFNHMSKIADAKARVGNYPGRVEAESMTLDGYTVRNVMPAEDASGAKGIGCGVAPPPGFGGRGGGRGGPGGPPAAPAAQAPPPRTEPCNASTTFKGAAGWYNLHIQYFDQDGGVAHYRLFVNNQLVDNWKADLTLPAAFRLDSTTSTRRNVSGVALRPGDEIRIEGKPDNRDSAGLDYIEIEKM